MIEQITYDQALLALQFRESVISWIKFYVPFCATVGISSFGFRALLNFFSSAVKFW